jgi:hypothetical protein
MAVDAAMKTWENLDGPLINGRKAITEGLSDALEKAINDTADVLVTGERVEVAECNYEAAILFDALASAYGDYKRKACAAVSLAEIEVDGNSTLWRALHALREWHGLRYNYQPPLPISVYRQQGVGDEQIARIYGFFDDEGVVDFGKIPEEEAKPGTHYDAKTWVHPAKRKRMEIAKAAMVGRQPRHREYLKESDFTKSLPPSLDELVRLGAPASQISKLHGIDEDDAQALLRNAGTLESIASGDADAERLQRDTAAMADAKPKKSKS